METVGTVAQLWRYPVKSLAGERLAAVRIDERGVEGDRLWAVADPDGKLGSAKSTRRFRRMDGLLDLAASTDGELTPVLRFPDGRRIVAHDPMVHDALSEHVGRPVRLQRERVVSHFDEGPLHLVTTSSLAWLAEHHGEPVVADRMRANVLVDVGDAPPLVEDAWIGTRLALGRDVMIEVEAAMPRCIMVDARQVDIPRAEGLLGTLVRANDTCFGVVAKVERGGVVRSDDPVQILR